MSTVSIEINESNLIKNLGYAFSNSTTVLSEMMQNSRRSGATHIKSIYKDDEGILTVIDDGGGIDDMQKLLSLADSGWSEEVVENDHPFGMGWFSVIYSSSHIRVSSMGSEIEFDTKDVLSFGEVEVKTISKGHVGTVMELHGFTLGDGMKSVETLLKDALTKFASGFPIRVYLNDEEFDRPNALDSERTFHAYHPIGDICISGMPGMSENSPSRSVVAYLQGLPVYTNAHRSFGESPNIVHLNSRLFSARLPDRDCLIDQEENKKIIFARIRNEWRDYLSMLVFAGKGSDLVTKWFNTIRDYDLLDLFNHIDVLPPSSLSNVNDYPIYNIHWDNDNTLRQDSELVTREMVEKGEVTLVKRYSMGPDTSAMWMILYKSENIYFIETSGLPKEHWVHAHTKDWYDIKPDIEPLGEIEVKAFNGEWLSGTVTFCNSYRLTLGDVSIEIHDSSIGMGDEWDDPQFYVPLNDRDGNVVNHVSSFVGEHEDIDSRGREREEDLFALLVRFHRESTPSDVIKSLISDASLDRFDGLDGTYTITVAGSTIDVSAVAA